MKSVAKKKSGGLYLCCFKVETAKYEKRRLPDIHWEAPKKVAGRAHF
jgi:hypothetical protein